MSAPAFTQASFGDEAVCDRCGCYNPVWITPNNVWNKVIGHSRDTGSQGGFVCPPCFMRRAEEQGLATLWYITPHKADMFFDGAEPPSLKVGDSK